MPSLGRANIHPSFLGSQSKAEKKMRKQVLGYLHFYSCFGDQFDTGPSNLRGEMKT